MKPVEKSRTETIVVSEAEQARQVIANTAEVLAKVAKLPDPVPSVFADNKTWTQGNESLVQLANDLRYLLYNNTAAGVLDAALGRGYDVFHAHIVYVGNGSGRLKRR